ncbi:MAG: DUF6448 family protein [Pseudomonadota bacterium]
MRAGLHANYRKAMAAKSFQVRDVDAGREYVEAYVRYIHYVEAIYEDSVRPAVGHYPEGATAPHDDK